MTAPTGPQSPPTPEPTLSARAGLALAGRVQSDPALRASHEALASSPRHRTLAEAVSLVSREALRGAAEELRRLDYNVPELDLPLLANLVELTGKDPGPMSFEEAMCRLRAYAAHEQARLRREVRARMETSSPADLPAPVLAAPCPLEQPAATAAEEPFEGPTGGCWVWWNRFRHDVPKGVTYRMIEVCWSRDWVSYSTLNRDVYQADVLPKSICSSVNRVNKVLRRIGVPWRLSADSIGKRVRKREADPSRIPKVGSAVDPSGIAG